MLSWSVLLPFYLSFCVETQKQLEVCQPELINLLHFLLVTPYNRILRKQLDEINFSCVYNALNAINNKYKCIHLIPGQQLHPHFIFDK